MQGMKTETMRWDNDSVAFEVTVCLVAWEEKLVMSTGGWDLNGVAPGNLLPIMKRGVVRERHFPETEQCKETVDQHGNKENVVMSGAGLIMVYDQLEVVNGKGPFADSSYSLQPHAPLQGSTD